MSNKQNEPWKATHDALQKVVGDKVIKDCDKALTGPVRVEVEKLLDLECAVANNLSVKEEAVLGSELLKASDDLSCCGSPLDPNSIALQWLEENCDNYVISRDKESGKISVNGRIRSPEVGHIKTYPIRDLHAREHGPYYIHAEDSVQISRSVDFHYVSVDETIAQAVEMIITLYCPGDVPVEESPLVEHRDKDRRLTVYVSNVTVEEFKRAPETRYSLRSLAPVL